MSWDGLKMSCKKTKKMKKAENSKKLFEVTFTNLIPFKLETGSKLYQYSYTTNKYKK